ncbi:hypothetical protein SH661x_000010 [Planctomicrobium sp. SH661]|uniref:hypothetical protein n=1 Tax=Planctomicrobium sp. SH661 TaxID=3448124 RepID=UPI003F5C67A1
MITGRFQLGCIQARSALLIGACALPLMMGCPPKGDGYREMGAKDDVTNTHPDDHHHDAGPHGGHIIELGDFHGEVVMDDGRNVTVYILGDDAATAVPVADASAKLHAQVGNEKKEIALTAAPQDGETDGKTSRFTAAAELIPVEIIDIEDLQGEVVLIIAGKESTGKISHDHDHGHDHDHEHKEAAPAK